MYPEPGHRETFVKGVMPVKSVKPDRKSQVGEPLRYSMNNSFLQGTLSGRQGLATNSEKVATDFANGYAPSYGRILGLSGRLDKSVRARMSLGDTFS